MDKIKEGKKLSLEKCNTFFLRLQSPKIYLKAKHIEEAFIFSMMTVLNEHHDMKKYDFLYFVEFLEFLCRLAIVGVLESDTIEYKVFSFLEVIWEKMMSTGAFTEKEHGLRPVDEGQFKCI